MKNIKREFELMYEQNPNGDHDVHDCHLIGVEMFEDWCEHVVIEDLAEDNFIALGPLL